jgi:hypothetical protein
MGRAGFRHVGQGGTSHYSQTANRSMRYGLRILKHKKDVCQIESVIADINERATMIYRLLSLGKPGIAWPTTERRLGMHGWSNEM